ncbi:hypothetical protein ACPEIC_16955 [Stenotrophomonas sp. NPDC087984]
MSQNPGKDEPDAVAELPELIAAHRGRLSALLADIPDSGGGCRRGAGPYAGMATSAGNDQWAGFGYYEQPREVTQGASPAEEPEDTGTESVSEDTGTEPTSEE